MKRKMTAFKEMILAMFFLLLSAFMGYVLLARYYAAGFGPNTWINGIYCTGKTVEEVGGELLSQAEAPVLVIHIDSGWEQGYQNEIDLGELGYESSYLPALEQCLKEQEPFLWAKNIMSPKDHRITPQVSYDEEALREAFERTCVGHYGQQRTGFYGIGIDWKQGWFCYDGLTRRLDMDKAFALVKEAVTAGQYEINIDELDCFYDIPFTQEQEEIRGIWERLEAFQNCGIVYDMGDEKREIPADIAAHFLTYEYREDLGMDYPVLDQDGKFVLDREAVEDFVDSLAEEYDTYGKDREFMSTSGKLVTVPAGGTYGTKLDRKAEVAYLMEMLTNEDAGTGSAQEHIPAYEMQGAVRGKDDIGSTYVEVDMTAQKLYYYEDGELVLETDVVTGNMRRRMGTPQGVNYVYNKQKNRVLRGPGYASPVSFWMPVKGNIGLHDAGWRSEFGGEIYRTGGSHGCINLPKDMASQLYEAVEVGTPVIMFYTEES